MCLNTSTQIDTSNHSFLIDARLLLAMSGSAQSVFVGSNQIEASEEKLYLARQRNTDREQGERNKQGQRNKTLMLAACALGYVENTKERCRKHREIYLGTQLENCRCTHTHILSLMTDSRHNTPERDNKSVMCPVFETAVTLSSAGCHTLCVPSGGSRAPSCSLRDQAKIRSSLFHFRVTGGQ